MAEVEVPTEREPVPDPLQESVPVFHSHACGAIGKGTIQGPVREKDVWDVYDNEARIVDTELVNDWTTSLNFLLLFAAIFSAILAAFIIESKKLLELDPSDAMLEVMIFIANNMANDSHAPYTKSKFEPSNTAVSINCLLFGSLSASLVAALASVVALQWVTDYDAAITRGGSSPEDRAKRHQFRFAGVQTWKMAGIIEGLPLVLYFSVALFFVGVIQWMLFVNTTVGSVVAAGAVVIALFYLSSTALAVIFVSAPFKTPLSRWLYSSCHLHFVAVHWIVTRVRAGRAPSWIEKRSRVYPVAHKREDLAIESRADLKYKALNWLAQQVSISSDSRQRLVFLVNGLLEIPSAQIQSPEFAEGAWISILNFLSRKHLDSIHIPQYSREQELELALLVNCAALPQVKALISPTERHDYQVNPQKNPTRGRCPENGILNEWQWWQYSLDDGGQSIPALRNQGARLRQSRTGRNTASMLVASWLLFLIVQGV